jgi:hypothetical protein
MRTRGLLPPNHAMKFARHAKIIARHAKKIVHHAKNVVHNAMKAVRHAMKAVRRAMKVVRRAMKVVRRAMKAVLRAMKVVRHAMKAVLRAMKVVRRAMKAVLRAMKVVRHAMKVVRHAMKVVHNAKNVVRLAKNVVRNAVPSRLPRDLRQHVLQAPVRKSGSPEKQLGSVPGSIARMSWLKISPTNAQTHRDLERIEERGTETTQPPRIKKVDCDDDVVAAGEAANAKMSTTRIRTTNARLNPSKMPTGTVRRETPVTTKPPKMKLRPSGTRRFPLGMKRSACSSKRTC